MNRRYGRSFYLDLISRLRSELSDFQLTMDVMAGFPGETEEQFQYTLDMMDQTKPLHCHVFPYSRREGTRAARYQDIAKDQIRDRVNRLSQFAREISEEVRLPYIGRTMEVLVENYTDLPHGLTGNYMKVLFEDDGAEPGQLVQIRLSEIQGEGFIGTKE